MSWTPCKKMTVQRHRCMLIAVTFILLQLYIVYRVYHHKYAQNELSSLPEQPCRLHKDCGSNCSVCLDRKCRDIRSGEPCEASEFVENVQRYFQESKWENIEMLSVRCLGHLIGVQFEFQAQEEELVAKKNRQHDSQNFVDHMLVCDKSLWVYSSLLSVAVKREKNDGSSERQILGVASPNSPSLASQISGNNLLIQNVVNQGVKEVHKDSKSSIDSSSSRLTNLMNPNAQQVLVNQNPPSIAQPTSDSKGNSEQDNQKIRNAQQSGVDIPSIVTTHAAHDSNKMNQEVQNVFEVINQRNYWGGGDETRSGVGSMLKATVSLRQCLGRWIAKYNIRSVVDIPCGDANWQRLIPGIQNVSYMGFDISPGAVKKAKSRNPRTMKFGVLDLTSEVPPKADIIIMRDFIQHLPLHLGQKAIENARKSGATWLAISSYPSAPSNRNIRLGDYYQNNVQISPFNVHGVVEFCDNYSGKEKRDYPDAKVLLIRNKMSFI